MSAAESRRISVTKIGGKGGGGHPVGKRVIGWEEKRPQVGKRYELLTDSGSRFRTARIELITGDGFETLNSSYVLEVMESPDEGEEEVVRDELRDTVDITVRPSEIRVHGQDGTVIEGKVNLGKAPRVSDLLLQGTRDFIVVFDARVGSAAGKVAIVNKQWIAWVEPQD
jgi:hypothetical protein